MPGPDRVSRPGPRVPRHEMIRILAIGLPIVYLTGAFAFATMYLHNGGESVIDAITLGARWPMYIRYFLG